MKKSFLVFFLINIFLVSFIFVSYVNGQSSADSKTSLLKINPVAPAQSLEEVAVQI